MSNRSRFTFVVSRYYVFLQSASFIVKSVQKFLFHDSKFLIFILKPDFKFCLTSQQLLFAIRRLGYSTPETLHSAYYVVPRQNFESKNTYVKGFVRIRYHFVLVDSTGFIRLRRLRRLTPSTVFDRAAGLTVFLRTHSSTHEIYQCISIEFATRKMKYNP